MKPSIPPGLLRQLRIKSGYSIKQAAPLLGISESLLSLAERGGREPSEEMICRAANLYQVNEESLMLNLGILPSRVFSIVAEKPDLFFRALADAFKRYE